jgi:SWI/SNF-related matrix-associated actin-dependent regulator 1 of chromatin subfamily A
MAKMSLVEDVFYIEAEYSENQKLGLVKGCTWYWHPKPSYSVSCWTLEKTGQCTLCEHEIYKVWWTREKVKAMKYLEIADEAAKAALEERQKLEAASRATATDESFPRPEGLSYLPYQKAGIAFAKQLQGTLIADEMGLGKTIQAIGVINATPEIMKVLVLCPAVVVRNWEREMKKWLVRDLRVEAILGRDLPSPKADVVITNYDKLIGKLGASLLEELMRRSWDLLICDEVHVLKNPKAQRTIAVFGSDRQGVKGLDSRARRKIYLTGTPIMNRPAELWGIVHSLNPQEFNNWFAFMKRYAGAVRGEYGWDLTGATNLDELQAKLRQSVMIRRKKNDVLKELPPKRRYLVEITPDESDREANRAIDEEIEAYEEYEDTIADLRAKADLARLEGKEEEYKKIVSQLRDAGRIAFEKISSVRHKTALAKVPYVISHLEEMFEEGIEKVIVFAHHSDVIEKIREKFKDVSVKITGEMTAQQRDDAVRAFQTAKNIKLCIASIRAAGVGITLTAASNVVFAELDWVPAMVTQAEDRAHRIGQPSAVTVQHLVFDRSIDVRIAKALIRKQEIYDQALDEEKKVAAVDAESPVAASEAERPPIPQKDVEVPEDFIRAVHSALRFLAAMCDGAQSRDGFGFNKYDARVGRDLATKPVLSPRQALFAGRLVVKYKKQLPEELVDRIVSGLKRKE